MGEVAGPKTPTEHMFTMTYSLSYSVTSPNTLNPMRCEMHAKYVDGEGRRLGRRDVEVLLSNGDKLSIIPSSIDAEVVVAWNDEEYEDVLQRYGTPLLEYNTPEGMHLWYEGCSDEPITLWPIVGQKLAYRDLRKFVSNLKAQLRTNKPLSASEVIDKFVEAAPVSEAIKLNSNPRHDERPSPALLAWALNELGVELSFCVISQDVRFKFSEVIHVSLNTIDEWVHLSTSEQSVFWTRVQEVCGSTRWPKEARQEWLEFFAMENPVNQLLEYVDGCEVNENAPYQSFEEFASGFGIDVDELSAWAFAAPFTGCLLRQLDPGCLLRSYTMLLGPPGVGKSTFVRMMLPPNLTRKYWSDSVSLDQDPKQRLEATRKQLLLELPEWAGARKADFEAIKAWLTQGQSSTRVAWGRGDETYVFRYTVVLTANPETLALPANAALRDRLVVVNCPRRFKDPDGLELHEHMDKYRDHYWAMAREMLESNNHHPVEVPHHLKSVQREATFGLGMADDLFDTAVEKVCYILAEEALGQCKDRDRARKLLSNTYKSAKDLALISGQFELDKKLNLPSADRRRWPEFLKSRGFLCRKGHGGSLQYRPPTTLIDSILDDIQK